MSTLICCYFTIGFCLSYCYWASHDIEKKHIILLLLVLGTFWPAFIVGFTQELFQFRKKGKK